MDNLLVSIAARKAALDVLRPITGAALAGLQRYYDVELTYTSNAVERNTLTVGRWCPTGFRRFALG